MPKNAKISVYKEKEFEMYALWKSMPAYFRGMKKEQLLSHGFSDPLIQKIVKIKSQTEFAKTFHIRDLGTLTDWNNKIEKNNLLVKNFNNIFKEQMDFVNNKIALNPDIVLKNKIIEQRQLISTLKKENILYKKQLEIRSRRKPKPTPQLEVRKESETQTATPKNESAIFKTLKSYLTKWKK